MNSHSWVKRGFSGASCFLMAASPAFAEDLCAMLANHEITIVANGYEGLIGGRDGGLRATQTTDGGFSFTADAVFGGEQADKVAGTCKNRHLVMTRQRPGGFTQKYDGWLFERERSVTDYQPNPMAPGTCMSQKSTVREVAGISSHNGLSAYSWWGRLVHRPYIK